MIITISILLLILSGVFKAYMDYHSETTKHITWKNKWKTICGILIPPYNHWWYFGLYRPKYQERFPFSSTGLVFLTDFWHLYQFLYTKTLVLGILVLSLHFMDLSVLDSFYYILFSMIGIHILVSIPFESVYKKLKNG